MSLFHVLAEILPCISVSLCFTNQGNLITYGLVQINVSFRGMDTNMFYLLLYSISLTTLSASPFKLFKKCQKLKTYLYLDNDFVYLIFA